jgi:hypothetical protein
VSATRGLALCLCALGQGCGGSIPPEALPRDPIAFVRQEPSKGLIGLEEFKAALRFPNPDDPETLRARRTTSVALLSLPDGDPRPVPDLGEGTFAFDWAPDGFRLLVGRADPVRRQIELLVWNRGTGAFDRVQPALSSGAASIGDGPIRVAAVARVESPEHGASFGIVLYLEQLGIRPLPGGAPGQDPDVAPDGRTLVFVRPTGTKSREGTLMLARIASGEEPRALGRGERPRFSRDGNWIAFERRANQSSDVWIMRADGGAKRALTDTGAFDEEFPSPSPDGRFVVFAAARSDRDDSQLYVVRVADQSEVQITRTGQNSRPVW